MRGGASRLRAAAMALLALLLLELAAIGALLVASARPGEPPGPDPLPEVRDRPVAAVVYVDAECPACGRPAIATTEEMACNNELCPEYGRVQENENERPGVEECPRAMKGES